jgi:tetratricopeptide (TPR) repeat protein
MLSPMRCLLILVTTWACAHTPPPTRVAACSQPLLDEGLLFAYAFHHDQAIRAFSRAAEADPECALAHWGVALANGPHINNPAVDPDHATAAWAALQRAEKAQHATPLERELVGALGKRYADPQPADRKPLDLAYANAMREVWKAHPDNPDVGALFAEALMDLRPWDLWRPDGRPQPETPEILETLRRVIAIAPKHPMANHLYIHAVEASPTPEWADDAADQLRGHPLGHLTHMPSHIDVRRGRWQKAIEANRQAIAADARYQGEQGFYRLYMVHNRHMLTWAAIMRGQSRLALTTIQEAVSSIPSDWVRQNAALIDGFMVMPLEVKVRFGRWDEVLAQPDYPDWLPLSQTMRHAARAIAFLARNNLEGARAEQLAFATARLRVANGATFGNNSAGELLSVAAQLVESEYAVREGKVDFGVGLLRIAARAEDELRYDEPPDWIMPVRHALGAALLRAGRAAEAEAVYREDLARLPENGWSLWGLGRSLALQKKDSSDVERRFRETWKDADIQLSSSCLCLGEP